MPRGAKVPRLSMSSVSSAGFEPTRSDRVPSKSTSIEVERFTPTFFYIQVFWYSAEHARICEVIAAK